MEHRRGFTLLELLIVVAVIAILAAFLFPVFAQAREKARQAACLSNLKQIGAAVMLYVSDYDDTYPGGGQRGSQSIWVPGPQGTWENMPFTTARGVHRNVAPITVAYLLLPYVKNTQIFLCPDDPTGDRWGKNGTGSQWDGQFTRISYEWHPGLSGGWAWPGLPDHPGGYDDGAGPLKLAEVSRPSLLPMLGDGFDYHARDEPGESRYNRCFADGHAKFTRYVDWWVRYEQAPWEWDYWNPRLPVNIEKPCSPTCAGEAVRG